MIKPKNSVKNLSKLELLELLADQEREIQNLKKLLEQKNQMLKQKTLCMERAGNIAQAALALNGVFEAAQKAADQYVESVRAMVDENLQTTGTLPEGVSELGVCSDSSPYFYAEQKAAAGKSTPPVTAEDILRSIDAYGIVQERQDSQQLNEEQPSGKQEDKT